MLEETLLSNGISLHDQHSAMQLDIENMSYEVSPYNLLTVYRQMDMKCEGIDLFYSEI